MDRLRLRAVSPWNELFSSGSGEISIYEQTASGPGPLLLKKTIPLTPGPLVVVTKGSWPPVDSLTSVETIAASYVPIPIPDTSGIRLFNLAADVQDAGLKVGGDVVVNDIQYTLGSNWAPIPVEQQSFTVFDDKSNKTLATFTTTPPTPPFVFTAFLLGMTNQTGQYGPRTVQLIDAPEAFYAHLHQE